MGRKLLEKNGAEMANALASLATPLRNFMEDAEFSQAFKECTKRGVKTRATDILNIYITLSPLLLGDKHLRDTLQMLSVVEGKPISEMLEMNGTDLLADALLAWNEQIKPFFTRLGLSV